MSSNGAQTSGTTDSTTSRPVVAAVDGTPGSEGALRFAVHEARERHAPLRLVHVAPEYAPLAPPLPGPIPDLRPVGRAILASAERTARGLAADLELSTALYTGPRVAGIERGAEGAQLVVLGRETRHGLDRLLSGTVTAAVASRVGCPTVVVPSFWTGASPRGLVVAGIKRSAHAPELLALAFETAAARGARLVLVSAWELPDPYLDRIELRTHADQWAADGTDLMRGLVADWRSAYPDVPVDLRVVHGPAAAVLLDEAVDADLLLIVRRPHAIPPYGHLGGVAHSVLRLTEVPVEVVPASGGAETQVPELVLEQAGAPLK